MSGSGSDPELARLREQVAETDRAIVGLVNSRLELVAEIKRHKLAHGLSLFDPDRERWLLAHLGESNRGPLSTGGLEELTREILDLTKREVALDEPEAAESG